MQVNIHQAKTQFSRLVDRALAGEDVVIARNGRAVLRLVPLEPGLKQRIPGLSAGKGKISADFDEPLPSEIIEEFEK
jgi:prevent-host-death family protein